MKRFVRMKKAEQSLAATIEHWHTNRRTVLKGALLAGALSQLAWFTSCSAQLKKGNHLLSATEATIFDRVLITFFPDDGNGPSANDINAFGYIMWVLDDSLNRKTSENQFIIDGISWLNDNAIKKYNDDFVNLSKAQQKRLIDEFTKDERGEGWSSAVITLILEALLLDPIYGGNTNEAGWEWLNHTPGYPRPTEENRYETIMKCQLKMIPVTDAEE